VACSDGPAEFCAQALEAAALCVRRNELIAYERVVVHVLQRAALAAASQLELVRPGELPDARLFDEFVELGELGDVAAVDALVGTYQGRAAWRELPVETLGHLYEQLIARRPERKANGKPKLVALPGRKQSGSFLTPPSLTAPVVELALGRLLERRAACELKVCDPALGAGAFLVQACRRLERSLGGGMRARRSVVEHCLYGVDTSPLAAAVAEFCLWLCVGDRSWSPRAAGARVRVGDALVAPPGAPELPHGAAPFNWPRAFPEVFLNGGFDAVIGNPPWVAYAGRAAQPLSPALKSYFREAFTTYRGYPTLHGLFVERAASLAPHGVVALLIPSPVADLDGYRPVRSALARTHTVREPLLELGQDAFAGVTQPSFVLVADPGRDQGPAGRVWRLSERQRAATEAREVRSPAVLERLMSGESFPRELFGEMGFQTSREATQTLLLRASAPNDTHRYPLLEGRDVGEFREGEPRLFLRADPELLRRARVRLRPESDYGRVRFVMRQTAAIPIAALHRGLPFRNTLLAGFDHAELPPAFVVGLLNSALYRGLHLAARRDARQAAFPQVKIAHLRALPRPPHQPALRSRVTALAERATQAGVDAELRQALDQAVFALFELGTEDQDAIRAFLASRGHG
jgi:hypothetical protein